jgi:phosphohistidine phosphatase
MDLILLRHGKAEATHASGDFSRALVDKGREQSRRAAKLLKNVGALPDIVLTSPLVRARQTADEFCDAAGIPGAIIQAWLSAGMKPENVLGELTSFRDFKRIALIGHEPDFSAFIEWILGAESHCIEVKKGALACLRINPPSRQGTLVYLIPPKLTGEIDS